MNNYIFKINEILTSEKGFINKLLEENTFDDVLYKSLIEYIQEIKDKGLSKDELFKKYEECQWNSFISNIFHAISILYNIEWSMREYWIELNISLLNFHDYIDNLIFELSSLFSVSDEWNSYFT